MDEPCPDGPRLLFVADAGAAIGGGHVMRSLTLAHALVRRGACPAFLASPSATPLLDAFSGSGIVRRPVNSDAPAALAEAAALYAHEFDGLVFDHYRLDAADHRAAAGERPVLVIDDLADRALGCDLLADPGPDRLQEDYEGLVPAGSRVLLGPEYALVRTEFAAARARSLTERTNRPRAERVLVSLGLTDVGGITGRVVSRMLPRLGEAVLDVVVGRDAQSLEMLRRLAERDPRVVLHVEAHDMAELMCAADLAVGAGGSSAWERCVVGLPTLLLVLADNQLPAARALAARDAAALVEVRAPDFEAAFDRAFTELLRSPERRARLTRGAAKLCDGQGAARMADAMLTLFL